MKQALTAALAGALFGTGLAISGMTDPLRVTAFLDVSGDWDPTLAFVMGGALTVFGGGYALLRRQCSLPPGVSDPVNWRLIVGAVGFGVGWGLSGFCPGPALANLGRLSTEALVFVPAMAVGMVISQKCLKAE